MNSTTSHELATMQDAELIEVLRASLYPGASPQSCALVLGYCRAAGLDPMLKPVHLVPMYDKATKSNRDTIMPGIGLYRIQAARTGQYAGQDQPEFGPVRTMNYHAKKTTWDNNQKREQWVEKTVEYPEWCSVTIYRIVGGMRAAFTAVEYWIENYATAGRDTDAPNEMWAKRSRGQIAKCAEAQALRKAFPEVGSMPSADEVEGRVFEFDEPEVTTAPARPRRASEAAAQAAPALPEPDDSNVLPTIIPTEKVATLPPEQEPAHQPAAPKQAAAPATDTGEPASAGEMMNVIKTAAAKRINLGEVLFELGIDGLDPATLNGLTKAQFKNIKARL